MLAITIRSVVAFMLVLESASKHQLTEALGRPSQAVPFFSSVKQSWAKVQVETDVRGNRCNPV